MEQMPFDLEVLFPDVLDIEIVKNTPAFLPFSDEIIQFLNEISQELIQDNRTRAYPDVATFAFFCRRSNIMQIKNQYKSEINLRLGRGLVFHIAPSNVPVNFAYSWLFGLLAGNVNIVRVPSVDFEQINIICSAIKRIVEVGKYSNVTNRIILIRFDKLSTATDFFSSICDVRVIWGGDETIDKIRKSNIPSRSFDVTFADRYSLCVINADKYQNEADHGYLASLFYNDTFLFDQNACTAPHLIIWIGYNESISKAKESFWSNLKVIVEKKYNSIQPIVAVDKLTTLYRQAAEVDGPLKLITYDNLIWRIELSQIQKGIENFRCSSGYFSEYNAKSLTDFLPIINRKYQTLSYYGFTHSELTEFIINNKPSGIDRIVPIGRTTDFSFIWDGFDLIRTLSRCCNII